MENNTLIALQKLKVDCHYKKSTHFNAARRLKSDSNAFKVFLIIGTLAASFSTIMNVGIWDKIQGNTIAVEVIINVLGALGGFLILYSTTFSDYKSKIELASKHEAIATELNFTFKKIRNVEAKFQDNLIDKQKLSEQVDILSNEYIEKTVNAPITKDEDYNKARENFNKGFTSEYTDIELNC
jgi:hypothetical protein